MGGWVGRGKGILMSYTMYQSSLVSNQQSQVGCSTVFPDFPPATIILSAMRAFHKPEGMFGLSPLLPIN
jgi:hypothetical protein